MSGDADRARERDRLLFMPARNGGRRAAELAYIDATPRQTPEQAVETIRKALGMLFDHPTQG